MTEESPGRIKRTLKLAGLVVLVLIVAFGAYVGNLLTSNPYPRPDGQGWLRIRDMPRARGETGATIVTPGPAGTGSICETPPCAPQFVVVGGLKGLLGRTVADVDILDAGSGRWREGPSLPEPRHHPAAASIEGAVYVTGGSRRAINWAPEQTVWVLRPGEDSWARLPVMPEGRMGHAMVAAGGKLYVIGGRGRTSRVLIYDRTLGWSTGAAMPLQRDHLAAVFAEGKIYAIGGRDDAIVRRVDVYDIAADSWSEAPALPAATSGMSAELLGDGRIHVIGGEDPGTIGGGVISRHFTLAPGATEWSTGPRPLLAVHGAASDEVAGILIIAGGSRRQGAWSVLAWTGVTQRFDPRDVSAQPSPSPTTSPRPSPTTSPTTTGTPTALPS